MYEQERAGLGVGFSQAVNAAVDLLEDDIVPLTTMPGAAGSRGAKRLVLKRFPYDIVVREFPEELIVVAVAHHLDVQGIGGVVSAPDVSRRRLQLLLGARIVRAFNAIGAARMGTAHEQPGSIGMPIAGDDAQAIAIASRLIRDIGYEPVLVGGLAMGKYLMPGTPLSGENTPAEVRKIVATLK